MVAGNHKEGAGPSEVVLFASGAEPAYFCSTPVWAAVAPHSEKLAARYLMMPFGFIPMPSANASETLEYEKLLVCVEGCQKSVKASSPAFSTDSPHLLRCAKHPAAVRFDASAEPPQGFGHG